MEKFHLCLEEVPLIGHYATKSGLKIHPVKVPAVLKMPRPTDVKSLQRFNGTIQYLATTSGSGLKPKGTRNWRELSNNQPEILSVLIFDKPFSKVGLMMFTNAMLPRALFFSFAMS